MHNQSLFNNTPWHQFSEGVIRRAKDEASRITKDQFEANSKEQIVNHITAIYELEPLELRVEEKEQEIAETKINVTSNYDYIQAFDDGPVFTSAFKVIIHIPFSGPEILFDIEPSTHTLRQFSADVSGGKIAFSKEFPQSSATAESIEQAINAEIASYQTEVGYINSDLAGFNARLRDGIETATESRFQQIEKLNSIKTALKIPMEKSANPSPLNRVSVTVKKIAPLSNKKEEPGAYITDGDYGHIIDSMRSAGASMEGNRASDFQDEETLRDVMLVVLSGSMTNGIAGGELFHKKGKTDISIPFENKATFVAECKLWKGAKYTSEGIDQLLGYTTWRDAKTALIIFNKDNANFSTIQDQIEIIFTGRADYVRSIKQREGEWRFILTKPDDPGRQIEVHVLLFDLYNKSAKNQV